MEHNDAVRMQAVEKYILGELTPALRDEFESHYFDCAVCSFNLRAGVAFAATSRQFFPEPPVPARTSRDWFAWLRPAIAVPAFAALLFVIGYQNFVTLPQVKRANLTTSATSVVDPWFSLVNASVHGSSGTRVEINPGRGFNLFFDITSAPHQPDSTFRIRVEDSSGELRLTRTVSAQQAQKSILLNVPPGFREGDYKLVILEEYSAKSAQVGELPFSVAFSGHIQQH